MSKLQDSKDHYPVIVVGGGIVGAGIFRELSLHKVPSLLIDKKDFSSQTSQSSSKMLHGGIRYLENWDFSLVMEALHEKNHWLKTTPHLCYEQDFYFPVFNDSKRPLWMIKAGLSLYDALSFYKNKPHSSCPAQKTIQIFPQIRSEGLKGSGIYSDAIVDDAKLTLEVIYDALKFKESLALNHVSLTKLTKEKDIWSLELFDELTQECKTVTASEVIFATGPFTDKLLTELRAFPWQKRLLPSKGSHLWLRPDALKIKYPMVLTPKDDRVIFIVPWPDRILIGTTEVPLNEASFNLMPTQDEEDYLINNLIDYFPSYKLSRSDIIGRFAGIRPLVKEDSSHHLGKTARVHKIFQPSAHISVVLGGKYTTFRVMAADVTAPVLRRLGVAHIPGLSLRPLRQKSVVLPFTNSTLDLSDIETIFNQEIPRTLDDVIQRRLGHFYHNNEEVIQLVTQIQSKYLK